MNGTIEHVRSNCLCNGLNCICDDAPSDEQLLLDYRSRQDRGSFEELVHRYERELFGYLRHYLGDAEMAEDVFQQTFLQVHLKVGQFEAGRQVRPWLYTVATNQAIDYQRRNRRHRMASLDRKASPFSDDEGVALGGTLGGEGPSPAELTESAERFEEVRRAVEELPEQTRQVVRLVYFQGLKYREAAEILGIPVGTVKSRLHAALAKLQDGLGGDEDSPEYRGAEEASPADGVDLTASGDSVAAVASATVAAKDCRQGPRVNAACNHRPR